MAPRPQLEFLTGYVVEKSLSLDNLFVFLLVFRAFGVEPHFSIACSSGAFWARW